MSLDAMKQALEALEMVTVDVKTTPNAYETSRQAITALRAAIEQTQPQTVPAQGRLAEKIPARGTNLEPIVRKAFDRIYAEQDPERWSDQEPVAWVGPSWLNPETRTWESESFAPKPIKGWIPLYTAPRQWQGLTYAEIGLLTTNDKWSHIETPVLALFARAIEAKLKEKNARPVKPLTDEAIDTYFQEYINTGSLLSFADGVRFAEAAHSGAIEAKLKEKNT